uniref:Uncharacterized protein n=1 Tax=Prolemur simus TaxID=1328070 RepID=A0A8C8ZUP7_PROSS
MVEMEALSSSNLKFQHIAPCAVECKSQQSHFTTWRQVLNTALGTQRIFVQFSIFFCKSQTPFIIYQIKMSIHNPSKPYS